MATRWNPFAEMERIFERLADQLDAAEPEFDIGSALGMASIPIDVLETDEAFVVTADLPGFEPDEIDATVTDRTLRIEAERDREASTSTDTDEGRFIRRERARRSLQRTVRLPADLDPEAVTATYEDGTLTVNVPKTEPATATKPIEIEVA
jgi:HSP20 family protein